MASLSLSNNALLVSLVHVPADMEAVVNVVRSAGCHARATGPRTIEANPFTKDGDGNDVIVNLEASRTGIANALRNAGIK